MTERWLPVVGFEGLYEVSDLGRVRSLDRVITRSNGAPQTWHGQIIKPSAKKRDGHLCLRFYRDGVGRTIEVHRVVGEAFIGPLPTGSETLHGDGNPANNAASNLRYGTKSENNLDRVAHGAHHKAIKTHCPRRHRLVAPNLVPSLARRGCRTCLACARAGGRARKTKTAFSPEYAHRQYAQIMGADHQEFSR